MILKLSFFCLFFAGITLSAHGSALKAESYHQKPKLVLLLVIDQFRADYLTRFQKGFVRPGANGEVGGFNYLMSQGAYYPLAEYDVLQSMTCPGHAMIMTGSLPILNGIPLNEWYDKREKRLAYCADDPTFGFSPRHLRTTTVGDELKNSGATSKVITVALKDRSAIMLGGHRADLAVWLDSKKLAWTTSRFYQPDEPAWLKTQNEQLKKSGRMDGTDPREIKKRLSRDLGIAITQELAAAALTQEKLGKGAGTDILGVSFSSHDYLGHQLGPNAQEMADLTLFEDRQISKLLTHVKKTMGSLKDVLIILTADHGVAPTVEYATTARIDAGRINDLDLYKKLYARLDERFGRPKQEWIIASQSFNYYINPEALSERKVSASAVEAEAKAIFKEFPGVYEVTTRSEIESRIFPIGMIGEQLQRQYNPLLSGDIILIPRPFYYEKSDNLATHMTGFAYDRTVPLVLVGRTIKPGVYSNSAKVIDLAPTLSFVLGIIPPATSSGRVLSEIFQ